MVVMSSRTAFRLASYQKLSEWKCKQYQKNSWKRGNHILTSNSKEINYHSKNACESLDSPLCVRYRFTNFKLSKAVEIQLGLCNCSHCEDGIWGWLENGSSPWRLLVPLWWPHLAQDQFQTPLGVWGAPLGAVWLSFGPLSDQISTCLGPCIISIIKVQLLLRFVV